MGKNPAFQFYPSDWTRDLAEHPLEIEGAWIRIICKLWWAEPKGELKRTISQWSKILGVDEKHTENILQYIEKWKIGTVTFLGPNRDQSCDRHTEVTVMSRRMMADRILKNNNNMRKRKSRASQKSHGSGHKNVTPHLLSSSSKEIKDTYEKKRESNQEDGKDEKITTREKEIDEVIGEFNRSLNTDYKINSKAVREIIRGRLSEGFTKEDCFKVIQIKTKDWKGTEFEKYLRPSTLFRPTKFPEYLNQKKTGKPTMYDRHRDFMESLKEENPNDTFNL